MPDMECPFCKSNKIRKYTDWKLEKTKGIGAIETLNLECMECGHKIDGDSIVVINYDRLYGAWQCAPKMDEMKDIIASRKKSNG